MYIKEMVGTLFRGKNDVRHELTTGFIYTGLKEYPRPQLVRDSYINLNGQWDYYMTNAKNKRFKSGKIEVPFSPEARLSKTGADHILQPDEILTYIRTINIEDIPANKRLIIHFGAVDQIAFVYVNGHNVGKHEGGYTSFEIDITDRIECGENELKVVVRDYTDSMYYARGKQSLESNGMWYTAQSGIWQTVWMEWVPDVYIKSIWARPNIDTDEVDLILRTNEVKKDVDVKFNNAEILENTQVLAVEADAVHIRLKLKDYKLWTPEKPVLYDYSITYGDDKVDSYLAMRCFTKEKDDKGCWRLCLNHVPTFFNGVLDQGYFPESLMTPPSDEAMVYDIKAAKLLGFNMIRKHCKIEPMRWYYHCDRLGMVVWQDIINGGTKYDMTMICYLPTVMRPWTSTRDDGAVLQKYTGRKEPRSHTVWFRECTETMKQLSNVCSLGEWTIFNEGWGQFEAKRCTAFVKSLDDTRPVDSASGWFHQDCGDIFSEHKYFEKIVTKQGVGKPYVLSEYGGYGLKINNHVFCDAIYGYKNYSDKESFKKAYDELMGIIKALVDEGLCGAVYTQLTDIEEEQNGLLTYDRRVKKLERG